MNMSLRRLARTLIDILPLRWQCRIASARSRVSPVLGRSTFVHHSVQMLGKAFIRVGANSVISQDCWLNVNHRQGDHAAIEIGAHCFIGRRNFFSSGHSIRFADYVLTANDCQFLGSTHIVDDPMRPIITTGTSDDDVIEVGVNAFIGAGVRVVGTVRIGHGCVVGAGSLVTRDLPAFSQAHGSPAIVRKRYSVPRGRWVPIGEFTAEDEAALPNAQDYLTTLRAAGPVRMPYIASGSDMGNC